MAIFRSFAFKYSSVVYRKRLFSSMTDIRGVVLGVYSDEKTKSIKLTKFAENYNEETKGQLQKLIEIGGPISGGSQRTFWGVGNHAAVSVVGLGDAKADWDELEKIDGAKENVRIAAAAGVKALTSSKVLNIEVEDLGSVQSAAEGAFLGAYKYQQFRAADKAKPIPKVELAPGVSAQNEWKLGKSLAENQNWARTLANAAANQMTPTKFAENVRQNISKKVEVVAHDKDWALSQKMGSFLSVASGSAEPPIFLELTYNGSGDSKSEPICLVGKGITFDSGGISLKPSAKMDAMRADMSGGAIVVATINALAENNVKCNVKGFVPLTENLPSHKATKPGDVVTARNGKTICVDNTDAEGRLVLVDALDYAAEFKPKWILDIATLTGAMAMAVGDCLSGAFCNNEKLWKQLEAASVSTGDRVWRMPLLKHYSKQMTDFEGYDMNNISQTKGGGACTAAAFLREFVSKDTPWVHLDIAPVMGDTTDQPYLGSSGMNGRPLRTVYELIAQNYQSS